MADLPNEIRRINWPECFGFTHLFRAFCLATNLNILGLAMCGVLLTYFAGRLMDGIWPSKYSPVVVKAAGPATSELDKFVEAGGSCRAACQWRADETKKKGVEHGGAFDLLFNHARTTVDQGISAVLSGNFKGLAGAVGAGAMGKLWLLTMHPVYGVIFFVVCLVIWAFFGGAICRIAALQAARDDRASYREALAFARKKFLSFVAAPLMPIGAALLIAIPMYIVSWIGAIPAIGDVLIPLFFFLAIIGGFVLAFLTIGGSAGFSLMYPTVAVEGSDAFDALSRSFSYVYQRPWRTGFYALLSLGYSAICLEFVKYFTRLMFALTHFVVGLAMNVGHAFGAPPDIGKLDAMWQAPSLTFATPFWGVLTHGPHLTGASWLGWLLLHIWVYLVVGLVCAFAVSLYFSSSTLIYLLLRRDVDATDLEDVYLEEHAEEEFGPAAAAPAPAPAPAAAPSPETPAPPGMQPPLPPETGQAT